MARPAPEALRPLPGTALSGNLEVIMLPNKNERSFYSATVF
jgi:hypothetical protein